jgi:hypothetical protein
MDESPCGSDRPLQILCQTTEVQEESPGRLAAFWWCLDRSATVPPRHTSADSYQLPRRSPVVSVNDSRTASYVYCIHDVVPSRKSYKQSCRRIAGRSARQCCSRTADLPCLARRLNMPGPGLQIILRDGECPVMRMATSQRRLQELLSRRQKFLESASCC